LPLLIISSSEQSLRTTSIPFGPEAKTKQAISSALGGSRLGYWLCPSLLSAHTWGGLQSLYP
jgi:hypothetical protein